MATRKLGIIETAMQSKPLAATKGLINCAIEAFNNPPLAPDLGQKPMRRAAKKPAAKKAGAKTTGKTADRRLVATMEDYEVKYLAQKHSVTQKAVKEAVAKVGHSRSKVEAELKQGK